MRYFTGEDPQPGDIIAFGNGDRVRVRYIGVNGLGYEDLDGASGGGGMNPAQWSLVERDGEWANRELRCAYSRHGMVRDESFTDEQILRIRVLLRAAYEKSPFGPAMKTGTIDAWVDYDVSRLVTGDFGPIDADGAD